MDSRPQLFGAVFLPLALTFLLRGVMLGKSARQRVGRCHDRTRRPLLFGVFFGLAAMVILGLAAWSRRPVGRATASSPSGRSR